jgi:predicted secreted Zn-dependent protease
MHGPASNIGFMALTTLALVASSTPAGAAAPALEPALDAGVVSDTQTVTFDVFGTTAAALARQLHLHAGLPGANGWVATTTWQFRWSYAHVLSAAGCLVASPSVQVSLRTTMPRWNGTQAANQPLVARWTAFVDALQAHESGHTQIALAAAGGMADRLANVPAARTCADLDAAAQTELEALVRAHDTAQADYDVQTQHGLGQGAIFP